MIWHEEEHPRDELGQFTEKENAGGSPDKKKFRVNARYSEITRADLPRFRKTKALTSAVFNTLSSNRKTLERHGECEVEVFVSGYKYKIALFGQDKDYDYIIVSRTKI